MKKEIKIEKSRDEWKKKSVLRANNNRYLKKENERIRKERDIYKKELKELKLKQKEDSNLEVIKDKESLIYLSLELFMIGKIGFKAISRVLEVIKKYIGIKKTPCPQTIINWVTKLSISRVQEYEKEERDFFFMIDTSIGLGEGKILTVISVDTKHHQENDSAINLTNVNCVGVSVEKTWTGQTIASFLEEIISVTGKPKGYIKDGGKDLCKAVGILAEKGYDSHSIDDVSHVVANLFKKEYQAHPMFNIFLSECGKISSKFKQSILACLVPPKTSIKSRFMNLHRLVDWASKIINISENSFGNNDITKQLHTNIAKIPECKEFIVNFIRDANAILECQKIIKKMGLNIVSYEECNKIIQIIPTNSKIYIGFITWLEKHLIIAQKINLEKIGMPISSDALESLFGSAKNHGTAEIKDANRIALRIPVLCGNLTKKDAQKISNFTTKSQKIITDSISSLAKQRIDILHNNLPISQVLDNSKKTNIKIIPIKNNSLDKNFNKNNYTLFIDFKNINKKSNKNVA